MLKTCRLLAILAVATMAATFSMGSTAQAADGSGKVRFVKEADSGFETFVRNPSPEDAEWMREHFFRQKTYAPYFDARTSWYPNAWSYKDAYAVYADGRDGALAAQIAVHPEWVLKDGGNRKLFIPWGCEGGSCPQYAADIGNPGFRRFWIDQARSTIGEGYKGLFVDDVNMEFKVSNGQGEEVAPLDPRTGRAMTLSDWRRYMADFMVEIRAAFPGTEIAHNPIWFSGHDDPQVARALLAADYINIERGVNDNFSHGGGQFGYETLLRHIDWLQDRGRKVVLDSYADTREGAEYNLASYFLINGNADGFRTNYRHTPSDWWSGYDVDLGAAQGPRYNWNGLFRRDFERGYVVTNQPGSPATTIETPGGAGPDGSPRETVTLPAASGAVILGEPRGTGGLGRVDHSGAQPRRFRRSILQ